MEQFTFHLGEFSGSDILEFRKATYGADGKFQREDSLYVADNAFYFFLEAIFRMVIPSFDMFEDTAISRKQWDAIMDVDFTKIKGLTNSEEARDTLCAINSWVKTTIDENDSFLVLGV